MRKFNLTKGMSTALVAMALVTGLSVPVAATEVGALSQQEVTQVGAATVGAPAIGLKESTGSGQTTTSWTFTYSPVPASVPVQYDGDEKTCDYDLYVAVFNQGDRTKMDIGSSYTDELGKKVIQGRHINGYVNPVTNPSYKYEFEIEAKDLTPGKKEVVAYLFDAPAYYADVEAAYTAAKAAYDANPEVNEYPFRSDAERLGISLADYLVASTPISIEVGMETAVYTTVTATSIQLDMSAAGGATGYEVYRKIDGKYKKVGTVSSYVYTDKGLDSKTTYSYKVRPYYIDKTSGQTTYGKYTVVEATTKGSALNAQLSITNKNKVKLTWQKVANATKYEIYRLDTTSQSSSVSKGQDNGYTSYKKIASLKKNKKTYTDKNVSANRSYRYIVRAVLPKDKNIKGDKDCVIEAYLSADFNFGGINVISDYTDATGNRTLKWDKVNGATGYVVEKYTYLRTEKNEDGNDVDVYDWLPYTTLAKSKTTIKLPANYNYFPDGTVDPTTKYRIKASRGTEYSYSETFETTLSMGNVQKVTAAKTENGIKVSWTPVAGAAYYKVYRVRTDYLENNKDIGAYALRYGTPVTEYVGVTQPVAVDVAAWNAAVDAGIAQYQADYKAWADGGYQGEFDRTKYFDTYDKLSDKRTYHYQNYSYARDRFDANTTSIVDYFGDIYAGSGSFSYDSNAENNGLAQGPDGKYTVTAWKATYNPVVQDDAVKQSEKDGRPQPGVSYTYYVQAFAAPSVTEADYVDENHYYAPSYYYTRAITQPVYNTAVTGPQLDSAAYASTVAVGAYKEFTSATTGVKTLGKATYTLTKASAKPTIKSLSSSNKKVTIKIKKKVSGASYYKIYRAAKKKGNYVSVGVTSNAKILKFTDSGLKKGKTYYYKVVAVTKNEAGAEVESPASAVKSVKVK